MLVGMAVDCCGDSVDGYADEDGGKAEEENEGDFTGEGLVRYQISMSNRRHTVSWASMIRE